MDGGLTAAILLSPPLYLRTNRFFVQTMGSTSLLNNIVEQDHRSIKRRVNASLGFRSFDGAQRTIRGYEAMHMIRKGQVRRASKG
jgi:transposase-like protein